MDAHKHTHRTHPTRNKFRQIVYSTWWSILTQTTEAMVPPCFCSFTASLLPVPHEYRSELWLFHMYPPQNGVGRFRAEAPLYLPNTTTLSTAAPIPAPLCPALGNTKWQRRGGKSAAVQRSWHMARGSGDVLFRCLASGHQGQSVHARRLTDRHVRHASRHCIRAT